ECAKNNNIPVRGYVSCVLGCPYEGGISADKVIAVVEGLFELGCYEVSLGDTIGVGTVTGTKKLLLELAKSVSLESTAVHFHDTYGQALPNILTALECGVSIVDSSIGGLGGCPYAKGASGNVATEDVVYMLDGMGVQTGVELEKLVDISKFVFANLKRSPASRVRNFSKDVECFQLLSAQSGAGILLFAGCIKTIFRCIGGISRTGIKVLQVREGELPS
ncbi:MAG: hypothetical protein J4F40_20645, partial [Alphaproteobacteria bacterium]|nr:hypothetical protein [Alphaproteobacteria bacterium]